MNLFEELKAYEELWEQDLTEVRKKGAPNKNKGLPKKSERPSPENYFGQITASADAAVSFIKDQWAPGVATRRDYDLSSTYAQAVARETNGYADAITKDTKINYKAFLDVVYQKYGLNVKHMIKTSNFVMPGGAASRPAESDSAEPTQTEGEQQELKVSSELIKRFHKQNMRILKLLIKYTDISHNKNIDIFDLLSQLDANRLENIQEAEKDFQGI